MLIGIRLARNPPLASISLLGGDNKHGFYYMLGSKIFCSVLPPISQIKHVIEFVEGKYDDQLGEVKGFHPNHFPIAPKGSINCESICLCHPS